MFTRVVIQRFQKLTLTKHISDLRVLHKYQLSNKLESQSLSKLESDYFHKIKNALIGDKALNKFQEESLHQILDKESDFTMIVQPTGTGKSLCYQLPILMDSYERLQNGRQNSMGIVFTPLVALMEDQIAQLHKKGVVL